MSMTVKQIAELVGGKLDDDTLSGAIINGVSKIEDAGPGEITFLANQKYARFIEAARASAILIPEALTVSSPAVLIRVADPYHAFLKVVGAFHPPRSLIDPGIHETAVIGEGTRLGESVSVGAHVVIGKSCVVGKGTTILPGTVIGDDVEIGTDCLIHAKCSLREQTRVGNRVVIQDGAVIGGDGFGFAPVDGVYHKIPQVGIVVIEDDVEIGANTTIDRATLGETRIRRGAKLDNLIQVAHNCTVGEHTVIAAQAGLSGSTLIGNGVRIGGQAGFAGHMEVGDGAAVGAQAGVSKSVPPGVMVSGYPARPHREELKKEVAIQRLPEALQLIQQLRRRIEELEEQMRDK